MHYENGSARVGLFGISLFVAAVASAQGLPDGKFGGFIPNAGQYPRGVAARCAGPNGGADFFSTGLQFTVPNGTDRVAIVQANFINSSGAAVQVEQPMGGTPSLHARERRVSMEER